MTGSKCIIKPYVVTVNVS